MVLSNGVVVINLQDVIQSVPSGYYMDVEGNIWTTRIHSDGTPVKVMKAATCFGSHIILGNQRILYDDLVKKAKQTTSWDQAFHAAFREAVLEAAKSKNNTKPVKGGYVIAAVRNGALSFSSKPHVHSTLKSAEEEMSRLARLDPGVTFVALKIEKSVTASQLVWD